MKENVSKCFFSEHSVQHGGLSGIIRFAKTPAWPAVLRVYCSLCGWVLVERSTPQH